MKCAVIDRSTNKVVNFIVADATSDKFFDYLLVNIPEDSNISLDWIYNNDGSFSAPIQLNETSTSINSAPKVI